MLLVIVNTAEAEMSSQSAHDYRKYDGQPISSSIKAIAKHGNAHRTYKRQCSWKQTMLSRAAYMQQLLDLKSSQTPEKARERERLVDGLTEPLLYPEP